MRGRYIKGNKTTRTPTATIVLDTETSSCLTEEDGTEHHSLKLWCATYWREEKGKVRCREEMHGTNCQDFWQWVDGKLSKHRPTWIWAHNAAFDLTVLEFWLRWEQNDFVPKFYSLGDGPFIIVGWIRGRKLVFNDSFNWLPTSIAKIGKSIGLPKLEMPQESDSMYHLLAYCRRDVEILERAVLSIYDTVRTVDMGCMRYTAAAQAYRHWRHTKGEIDVLIPPTLKESELARRAYYSGRVEPFFIGKVQGPVYVLDVNAMYGFAMANTAVPCKMLDITNKGTLALLNKCMASYCAVADVRIKTEKPYPVRLKDIGVVYAIGEFCTTLCGCELFDAWYNKHITDVGWMAYYKLDYVCKEFAEFWWKKRLEYRAAGNEIMERMAKQMPCALYGKWAQQRNCWQKVEDEDILQKWGPYTYYDPLAKTWIPGRVIAGICEVDVSKVKEFGKLSLAARMKTLPNGRVSKETEHSFPAISAWITSAARQIMDNYRLIAGEGNVYYQCHDCLHVNEQGYLNLLARNVVGENVFGGLKVKETVQNVEYINVNTIRVDGVLRAAGLPSSFRETEEGRFVGPGFERVKGIISRPPNGCVRITRREWSIDSTYNHGIHTESGWCEPIRLG